MIIQIPPFLTYSNKMYVSHQYLRFNAVVENRVGVDIPSQEVLVHRHGVDGLEEQCTEGHVVVDIQAVHQPPQWC